MTRPYDSGVFTSVRVCLLTGALSAFLTCTASAGSLRGDDKPPTFFTGYWWGHDRGLTITWDGRATEFLNTN